jgi:maleate isomerase
LPEAAALLPNSFNFSAIGYGCTSGATIIGEDRVEKAIQSVHPATPCSNPLTACKAALRALGLKRVALLTPYHPDITTEMRDNLLESDFEIPVTGSFFETDDFIVGRISAESTLKAILKIGASAECDGVFVSCTNLRVAAVIEEAEARLGKPVTSSNHALAWHLLRLSGIQDCPENFGSLFQKQLKE